MLCAPDRRTKVRVLLGDPDTGRRIAFCPTCDLPAPVLQWRTAPPRILAALDASQP